MGVLSGSVLVRPVRVAFAVAPQMGWVRRAVRHATATWGGAHYVLATSDNPDSARTLARISASDVIVSLDHQDAACLDLAQTLGYRWRGEDPWASYEDSDSSLLGPEIGLQHAGDRRFRPQWDADDPLADLFAVWFGEYGDSAYERELCDKFDAAARHLRLEKAEPVPILGNWITPVEMTALDIEYQGFYSRSGFVLIDPTDVADLITLWNLRALGNQVFPWPLGHEARVRDAADDWLRSAVAAGIIGRSTSADGRDERLHAEVWIRPQDTVVPAELGQLIAGHGLSAVMGIDPLELPPRSRSHHPMTTDYSRTFSLTVAEGEDTVAVQLPAVPFRPARVRQSPERIVAAQVTVFREAGFSPGEAVTIPNARMLTPLLISPGNYPELFHRPTADGRALGVSCYTEQVVIGTVVTEAVVGTVLERPGWTITRSPSGRFATQLIERLGGPRRYVGNQPAVRWVLDEAARAPHGKPIAKLISTAQRNQGSWPGGFFVSDQAKRDYPLGVIQYLLGRKILRPLLPVPCPHCATTSYLPPEGLATDITCEMCGKTTPLGLITSLAKHTCWNYRPANALTAADIAETMPIMASIDVLLSLLKPVGGSLPYVLGVKVADGKGWSCEIDVVLLANLSGTPLAILGEVKSYRDSITATDLANLAKVQNEFRAAGFECLILASTLRERLEADELRALREACELSPADPVVRYGGLKPVLPLVFTAADLSAPERGDEHPGRWRTPDFFDVAVESCRRNLGLQRVDFVGDHIESKWAPVWATMPEGGDEALKPAPPLTDQ